MHIYMHPAGKGRGLLCIMHQAPRGLMEVYLHYHVTDKCPHVTSSGRDPQKFSGSKRDDKLEPPFLIF